jgi:hypothetical protein
MKQKDFLTYLKGKACDPNLVKGSVAKLYETATVSNVRWAIAELFLLAARSALEHNKFLTTTKSSGRLLTTWLVQ